MEKMKKIKNRIIMLVMIMMAIMGVNTYCAEGLQEVDIEHIDINKSYEGFMKNFIVELGQMQVSLYDEKGQLVWKYNVLPKEFEGKSEITRMFWQGGHSTARENTDLINYGQDDDWLESGREYTIHGIETWILQKNEGKMNISEMIKRSGVSNEEVNVKYSDNIPCLLKIDDEDGEYLSYLVFTKKWTTYTDTEAWKSDNGGENVNNLAKDLGEENNAIYKSFENGASVKLYDYIMQTNSEGYSPSLILEPLTIYYETTEQIYLNDWNLVKSIAEKYSPFQWNSDTSAYLDALEKAKGKLGLVESVRETIRLKLLGGALGGLCVYYDCGIMEFSGEYESEFIGGGEHKDFNISSLPKATQEPRYVNLSYTDTTNYSKPYATKGFWFNYGSKVKSEQKIVKKSQVDKEWDLLQNGTEEQKKKYADELPASSEIQDGDNLGRRGLAFAKSLNIMTFIFLLSYLL